MIFDIIVKDDVYCKHADNAENVPKGSRLREYSSMLGRAFEWKVKGNFLEKKGTFLCEKDPKLH